MKALSAALILACLPLPLLAQTSTVDTSKLQSAAGTLSAADPGGIAAALQRLGYKAELTKDEDGDPKIKSAAAGANYAVYFYGCTDGKDCNAIQFSAGFDTDNGLDLSAANEWNRDKRYGKVYLDDERDPYIELDMNMIDGISEANFDDTVGLWDSLLADFQKHIDW